MGSEWWIVKTLNGKEWGFLKRLILDPMSKQISHADVVLSETGRLTRIPWASFEVQDDGIKIMTESQNHASSARTGEARLGKMVAMELWP